VTKRRPSWSDPLWLAASLICGLLLLDFSLPLEAAEKPPHKAAPAKKAAAAKRGAKKAVPAHQSGEIGTAEIVESETTGLRGSASFYGKDFNGRRTATGETFDLRSFTAASNRFPLGSWVAVRRLDSDRCAVVKVNDRMHARHRRRIIDVSRGVAEYLDMVRAGVVLVRVAPLKGDARDDQSCQAAFEAESWPDAPPQPQLDAMH
jgi:peptidoglycan lytic transglycosylase